MHRIWELVLNTAGTAATIAVTVANIYTDLYGTYFVPGASLNIVSISHSHSVYISVYVVTNI